MNLWTRILVIVLAVALVVATLVPVGITITGGGMLSFSVGVKANEHHSPVFHSGFEISDFSEWGGLSGAPSVVETQKKTGTYAMQAPSVSAYVIQYADPPQGSFYFRVDTLPTSGDVRIAEIIWEHDGTHFPWRYFQVESDGDVTIGATVIGTTGSGEWHRCSWVCSSIASYRVYAWLDGGSTYYDDSADFQASDSPRIEVGWVADGTGVADVYIDDVFLDDDYISGAGTDPGDIRVARASPNAAGTYAQYDSVSGYTNVDEIPANDGDYIEDNGSDAARESYNITDLADLDGASAGDTINAVSIWIRGDMDGGPASDHMAMVRDNGSDYNSADLAFNGIAWFSKYYAVMPDDSAAWTETRFNSLEIGAYHLGGQDQRVHCLVAMVAYTPAGAAEADISNTPTGKAFGSVSEDTDYWSYGSEPSWPLDDGECFFEVTNNSGAAVDITIEGGNFTGGDGWTLTSGVPGEGTVRLRTGKSGDANQAAMVVLTTSPQSFITSLADSASMQWELKLETGAFTDGVFKETTLTLTGALS